MVSRIASLDKELCNSKKCQLECIRFCPVNLSGSECIILGEDTKAIINEELCNGCGICIKKCPFDAINIVKLPDELDKDKIHQYDINSFRLYKLPMPVQGQIIGLVGKNGIGKSTALQILSGNLIPNLGDLENSKNWGDVKDKFNGSELKNYFEFLSNNKMKISLKPQAVYDIPKIWKDNGETLLKKYDERNISNELIRELNLEECIKNDVNKLSGGELQRLAVAIAIARDADVYFFDEPSAFNDVYQRLIVANVIRKLANSGKYIILVEHDLTFLDYMSDYIHILYGEAGTYGIVSGRYAARIGINALLDGYIPNENIRFRESGVTFNKSNVINEDVKKENITKYTDITKKFDRFQLDIKSGSIKKEEIIGIIGANSLGKTTFLKILSGIEKPNKGKIEKNVKIAYKPQYLDNTHDILVKDLLIQQSIDGKTELQQELMKSFNINKIIEKKINQLSGGELQKLSIMSCLSMDADIFALDEPSAFIDIEDRIMLGKIINKFIKTYGKSAIIADHDLQLIDVISDSIMIFNGRSGIYGNTTPPLTKEIAMNLFLKELKITYRRDIESGRPRVNKNNSKLDREQKLSGNYYYIK